MNIRNKETFSISSDTSCLDIKIQATDLAIKEIENEMECINEVLCSLKQLRTTAEQERVNILKQRIEYLQSRSYN